MPRTPARLVATLGPILLLSISLPFAADATLEHSRSPEGASQYGRLLDRYVTAGGVRYEAWRASPEDMAAISSVVAGMSRVDPVKLGPADRNAFFINLYNASVLEIVLIKNPKESIKEITPGLTGFGVFLKDSVAIGKKKISLHALENRLREESKDPRIHFAINCASRSCPPIAQEPYRGDSLDAQLDKSTRAFLALPGALVLKTEAAGSGPAGVTIECSKIFDWYSKDFEKSGGAVAFIRKYGPPEVAAAIKDAGGKAKLVYQDYDWSLNAAKP